MFVSRFCTAVIMFMSITLAPVMAYSGSLDSPADPTHTDSAMYTLTDIYNRLDTGTTTAKRTGAFTEPSSGPAATGKTLDDVMGLVNSRAPVEKTGQTTSYSAAYGAHADGADGDLQKGVTWPSPRFTDNTDGTVSDNLTGLIWLKNANAFSRRTWEQALSDCNTLANGTAGLTDGSAAGDWRLPNVKELLSLIDYGHYDPALPSGHPFSGVQFSVEWSSFGLQASYYWSGTTYSTSTVYAWNVYLGGGSLGNGNTADTNYVWPVRAGQ